MTTPADVPPPGHPAADTVALGKACVFAARALAYIDAEHLDMARTAIQEAEKHAARAYPDSAPPQGLALVLESVDGQRAVALATQFCKEAAA